MNLQIAPKPTDALVATPIVHQTAFWGRVHRRLGFDASAFDLAVGAPASTASTASTASGIALDHGDVLVLRAALGHGADFAYVPFGPELAPALDDVGRFLEQLSHALRPLLGPRCAFVRWDLPWTAVHARDARNYAATGEWLGPPARALREIRMNAGTRDRNLWKAPRDLLPPDTVVVDLRDPEAELLARMHPKTRYNIRLALRRGVVVEDGTLADLDAWYAVYLQTTARHGLAAQPLEHFTTLLEERAEGSASPVVTKLLLARRAGELLAGLLLALTPTRATYLYGASTRTRPELMASYALQWRAIQVAKAHGCIDYDLLGAAPRGDAPHPLAGVHRFKRGFGGALVHREGCWDFPFDETAYTAWRGWEAAALAQRRIAPPR